MYTNVSRRSCFVGNVYFLNPKVPYVSSLIQFATSTFTKPGNKELYLFKRKKVAVFLIVLFDLCFPCCYV